MSLRCAAVCFSVPLVSDSFLTELHLVYGVKQKNTPLSPPEAAVVVVVVAVKMWQSVGLTLLVIVATLVCALLFMLFGWYVVWQLFLSKFKFLRELVGDATTPQAETQPSETKSERVPNAPTRNRPRTARQRVAFPESTS